MILLLLSIIGITSFFYPERLCSYDYLCNISVPEKKMQDSELKILRLMVEFHRNEDGCKTHEVFQVPSFPKNGIGGGNFFDFK